MKKPKRAAKRAIVYEPGTIPAEELKKISPELFQFNTEEEAIELIAMYGRIIANVGNWPPDAVMMQNNLIKYTDRIYFLSKQLAQFKRSRA